MTAPLRVAVTGAAGQIGYSILPRIAAGEAFGKDQPLVLQLLEIPAEGPQKALRGVAMELDDCAFPLLQGMVLADDPRVAFADADWCVLVGAKPRGPGMERADLLKDNGAIFIEQGRAIDEVAADEARVVVVGNPCNTNCMIAASQASRLGPERFTAMTRLDQNRARTQLAQKAGVPTTEVEDIIIFGNHSPTMFADFTNARIGGRPAREVLGDDAWLEGDFLSTVGKRGAAVTCGLCTPPATRSTRWPSAPTALTASTRASGPRCRFGRRRPARTRSCARASSTTTSGGPRSPRPTPSWSRSATR